MYILDLAENRWKELPKLKTARHRPALIRLPGWWCGENGLRRAFQLFQVFPIVRKCGRAFAAHDHDDDDHHHYARAHLGRVGAVVRLLGDLRHRGGVQAQGVPRWVNKSPTFQSFPAVVEKNDIHNIIPKQGALARGEVRNGGHAMQESSAQVNNNGKNNDNNP